MKKEIEINKYLLQVSGLCSTLCTSLPNIVFHNYSLCMFHIACHWTFGIVLIFYNFCEKIIGEKWIFKGWGRMRRMHKITRKFYYIPLLDTVWEVLRNSELRKEMFKVKVSYGDDGVYSSFLDGAVVTNLGGKRPRITMDWTLDNNFISPTQLMVLSN